MAFLSLPEGRSVDGTYTWQPCLRVLFGKTSEREIEMFLEVEPDRVGS